MEKAKKLKTKMMISLMSIITVTSLLLTAVLSTFAWFAVNSTSYANGFALRVSTGVFMKYDTDILATRYQMDGSRIENVYRANNNGILYLVTSYIYQKDSDIGENNKANENPLFVFQDMIPGEYVDISISYYVEDEMNEEYFYKLEFSNFNESGTFDLLANNEEYTHSILGIFKFRPMSMKITYRNGDEPTIHEFDEDEYKYKWMVDYDAFSNDVIPEKITLLDDTEFNKYEPGYDRMVFTFRINEDLTQYYHMLSESGSFATDLLSRQVFSIGNLLLSEKEAVGGN